MLNFERRWTAVNAIRKLYFFGSASYDKKTKEGQALDRAIRVMLGDTEVTAVPINESDRATAEQAVRALKKAIQKVHPDMKLRFDTQLHPIVWMRWAITSSPIPMSFDYIKEFFAWRAKTASDTIVLMQHRRSDGVWTGSPHALKLQGRKGKIGGYPLDGFLVRKKFNQDVYTSQWRVRRVKLAVSAVKVVESRTPEQVCGAGAMAALRRCIEKEVQHRQSGHLSFVFSKEKKKFTCQPESSRQKLVNLLKTRHTELTDYKDTLLVRTISHVVAFRRGRPHKNTLEK